MRLKIAMVSAAAAATVLAATGAWAFPGSPKVDHHQHLLSPADAERIAPPVTPLVATPGDIAALLQAQEHGWNDKAAIRAILADDAVMLDDEEHGWIKGADAVADRLSSRFGRPYRITPVALHVDGDQAFVVAHFTRGEGAAAKAFGAWQISLRRIGGSWKIAAASPDFPGPQAPGPIDAAQLIKALDDAGIRRAVVLSLAYWWGNPRQPAAADEYDKVRAENDWTIAQAARFPDRLTPVCSVNPLKDYAVAEVARCARIPAVKGLKLHFGNSDVDVANPDHLARVKRVFAAADASGLAIIAHLWTDPDYGRKEAEIFLAELLPAAPHVTVQIAHMAGGGPGWTDAALEVLADAVARKDPRTRRLYFDVATVADRQTREQLDLLASRIRQIGPQRILYGSDASFGGNKFPWEGWRHFRGMVPLTEQELATIANNVAPYLK